MLHCSFCPTALKVFCSQCQTSTCAGCAISSHIPDHLKTHQLAHLCQECEEETAEKFCENCDQYLCSECDTRIHNKGKRAQHTKKMLTEETCFNEIRSLVFVTSAFFDEQLMKDFSEESLKSRLEELMADVQQNLEKEQVHGKKVVLFAIERTSLKNQADCESFLQAVAKIEPEDALFCFTSPPEDPQKPFNNDDLRASIILSILHRTKEAQAIHLYDTLKNSALARSLSEKTSKPVFVNCNPSNTQLFKSSIFVPEIAAEIPHQILRELQPLATINIPQRPISNAPIPNLPQNPLPSTIASNLRSAGFYDQTYFSAKENIHPNTLCFNDVKAASFEKVRPERPPGVPLTPIDTQFGAPKSPIIPEAQPVIQIELCGSLKAGALLQRELMDFADKGDLLIPREVLVARIMQAFGFGSMEQAEGLLEEAEENKIVHMTIRKFLHNNAYHYIGLLLNTISIESLVWVIKSIRNDSMTPTEKLILSRIKECYGLKVDQIYWKSIQSFISANSSAIPRKAAQNTACPLYIKSILDPVTNLETNAMYLTNEEWVPEDQGQVDDKSAEWATFVEFIDEFFDEKTKVRREKERIQQAGEPMKMPRWSNSVENVLSRTSSDNGEKLLSVTDDVKAIPGGRYGCAQFIKYCGPENLRELSLGRLSLLVQEAINKNILKYQRTLLIKNSVNDMNSSFSNKSDFETEVLHSLNAERKAKTLSMVREALLEILMEHADGISLAQIPFYLKKKLKFTVDFQELGFPKLKNFLATLKSLVVMQISGSNHTFVKLKGPLSQQSNQAAGLQRNGYPKRRFGDIDNQSHGSNYFPKPNGQAFKNPAAKLVEKRTEQKMPFNELKWIKDQIDLISRQNMSGIIIQDLYRELCIQLNGELSFKAFGCNNFYEFLIEHADSIVDIAARKDGLIIYPKAQNFWVKERDLLNGSAEMYKAPSRPVNPPISFTGNPECRSSNSFSIGSDHGATRPSLGYNGMTANSNQYQQHSKFARNQAYSFNHPMDTSTLNTSCPCPNINRTQDNSNILDISPIIFSGTDFNEATQLEKPKSSNVSVSNWNLNFNFNNSMHAETGDHSSVNWQHKGAQKSTFYPKNVMQQRQEDSNVEIQDNLRFIEELLQESDDTRGKVNSSMGYLGNRSYRGPCPPAQQPFTRKFMQN